MKSNKGTIDRVRPYTISSADESLLATPRGWVCPVCNRVLAPSQPFCMFCLANTNKQPINPVDYISTCKSE
jgi:uncharacterized OB-fold protein